MLLIFATGQCLIIPDLQEKPSEERETTRVERAAASDRLVAETTTAGSK